jgi:2-oxo-4-hydroxy-4-carboxy-5-ureidoimidazoline decarboxylase
MSPVTDSVDAAAAPPLRLADVNAMDEAAFVAAFGALYEHSPWVARAAWPRRPFADVGALRAALEQAMRAAPRERRLALIRAHPELAGREAAEGELTDDSSREQSSAGLDRLTAAEQEELRRLNHDYRERFGFPLVVCVRGHTKDTILAWGRERLQHERDHEVDTALGEISCIARLRLEELL